MENKSSIRNGKIKNFSLKDIVAYCKRYGLVFQSSEIYDGLSGVYDYGPAGIEIKNNLKQWWWYYMVHIREDVVGLDSAILMHPEVWVASGHVEMFFDMFVDDRDCKSRFRADDLIEAELDKKFNDTSREKKNYLENLKKFVNEKDTAGLTKMIKELDIACPVCGSKNWTPVRYFNLMFTTKAGATEEDTQIIYLRPETAQGIFINYPLVQKISRLKIPFGIAQVGKAFRNEIVLGGFLLRKREFEQVEMQYFITPGSEEKYFNGWLENRLNWYLLTGIPREHLRIKEHKRLAHYASAAVDIEYKFGDEFKEVEGIHSRTDYDLRNHASRSGKSFTYHDSISGQTYIPYVIETSCGVDRIFLSLIFEFYYQEEVPSKKEEKVDRREVLGIPAPLAPYKCAVFPLVKKEPLVKVARTIYDKIKLICSAFYEEKDTIGQRYRRQDAIGTPFCITVDFQTIENETVTIRDRDSTSQIRIKINEIENFLRDRISFASLLSRNVQK